MRKTGIGAAALSAALALTLAPGTLGPSAQQSPITAAVQAARDGTKTTPSTPAAADVDLNFLAQLGAPLGGASGCPWPGRRAACARRTAGRTRRMR